MTCLFDVFRCITTPDYIVILREDEAGMRQGAKRQGYRNFTKTEMEWNGDKGCRNKSHKKLTTVVTNAFMKCQI